MPFATIWTQEELLSDLGSVRDLEVWRMVEAQHHVATMKIVDSLEEQTLLEEIVESVKPGLPSSLDGLPYLLSTPFRYRPVSSGARDGGSRFRRAGCAEGVFYAAASSWTCAFETAFYRALFFAESPGTSFPSGGLPFQAFSTRISSDKVLDLTSHPTLRQHHAAWENLSDYFLCQDLAEAARRAGIEVIAYKSIRDPKGGKNFAILTPSAFSSRKIEKLETWSCVLSDKAVFMRCEFPPVSLAFAQEDIRKDPRFGEA